MFFCFIIGGAPMPEIKSIAIGDFNIDGKLDIIILGCGFQLLAYIGKGNGEFLEERLQWSYDTSTSPSYFSMLIAVGDINNDNYLDIVVANHIFFGLGVLFGFWTRDLFKKDIRILSTGNLSRPYVFALADVNKDNKLDLIVHDSAIKVGVFLGYGDGSFAAPLIFPGGPWTIIVAADLNNDNRLDIVGVNQKGVCVDVFLAFANGTFLAHQSVSTGYLSNPNSIAIDDFNNDNRLDVAVSNSGLNSVVIFIGNGDGTFSIYTMLSVGLSTSPSSIFAVDFNNDNRRAIAVLTEKKELAIFWATCY